jgi:hypothetical protein
MLKSIKTALQILAPTIDGHEQFIKMPGVAKAALALAKAARVKDAEAASPLPDGLLRHSDAAPATELQGQVRRHRRRRDAAAPPRPDPAAPTAARGAQFGTGQQSGDRSENAKACREPARHKRDGSNLARFSNVFCDFGLSSHRWIESLEGGCSRFVL